MLRVAREEPVVATEEARHSTKYVVDGSIQALRYPGGKEFEVEFAAGHGDTVAVLTVLVIIGAGHAPILRDLVEASPRMQLADPLAYL